MHTEMEDGDLLSKPSLYDLAQQWMLAAHPGAFSDAHIDGGGYCTWVRCLNGSKLWWIAVPDTEGVCTPEKEGGFSLHSKRYKWVQVVLEEGDEL